MNTQYYIHDGTYIVGSGSVPMSNGLVSITPRVTPLQVLVWGPPPCNLDLIKPGQAWSVKEQRIVNLPVPVDELWARVRYQRDQLLAGTDWRVAVAQESGQPMAPEWVTYRQALRDITEQADPAAIVWPTPPST